MDACLVTVLTSLARGGWLVLLGIVPLQVLPAVSASAQTIYVSSGNDILSVGPSGSVSTYATFPANAQAAGLAFDGSGDLYVADEDYGVIREVTTAGMLSTAATLPASSGSAGGLAFDASGNLYVADGNIVELSRTGVVSTFATLPANSDPIGLAFDANGNLYAADGNTGQISKITTRGIVSLFATLPTNSFPYGLAFDRSGNLYAAELQTSQIAKITPGGVVSTFTTLPTNSYPEGLAFDASGNLYAGDIYTNQISKITPGGTVNTFASNVQNASFLIIFPAPEPSSRTPLALGGVGLLGLVLRRRLVWTARRQRVLAVCAPACE